MVFLAGIGLSAVLIIPTAWFPFQLGKVALFALVLAVALVLFVAGRGVYELMRAHGFRLALLVAALPLAYLFSTFFSVDRALSVTGLGVEVDTLLFTVIAFLAFLLSFALFRTLRTAGMLSRVVFWSLAIAAIFQIVLLVVGNSFPHSLSLPTAQLILLASGMTLGWRWRCLRCLCSYE